MSDPWTPYVADGVSDALDKLPSPARSRKATYEAALLPPEAQPELIAPPMVPPGSPPRE